ncbi:hypothetical protein [Croceivirga thetidis]|uniref:DUF1761 domain-containing protein n=1 Tax=Croceivirga thetidis TaxID=2721623 RepID=A0ABX1GRC7_9FLAO|nr:hypothetical protein [Croceivirga thetidis]NKI31631.1 hypothetical protein [Croceivirga thetidis]
MFSKSNLLATLAAAFVMFLLGWAIWGFALEDFFESHTISDVMKDEPNPILILVSNLIGAFILSSIYRKWARGQHGIKEGPEFGIAVGAFTGLSMGLMWYATSNWMNFTGHLAEVIIEIMYYALVGIVISVIYNITRKADNS